MIGYEKYKLTHSLGFEKIPVEWDLKKVKYLFHIGRGRVISQEELMDNGLYPVFSSQTQNNGCLGYINTFDFDCDQLTWTTDGANAGTVFIRSGKHNCTNVCGTLQPITYQTNLKFSHYALQYATQFHKRPDTNGAKIMNNEMAEISFALPAECEQFKIIEYLDHETAKIDSLIAKQEKLIELLKEKRQAMISHAVTKGLNPDVNMKDSGVEWLGQVPEHWKVAPIKRIIHLMEQGKSPECENIPATSEQWGVLKTSCVNNGIFHSQQNKALPEHTKPHTQYQVKAGDVLMSRASGSINLIGSVALVPNDVQENLLLSDKIFRIHLTKDCDARFFTLLMATPYMRTLIERAISGAEGMANNITKTSILEFVSAIPPLKEQMELVDYLRQKIQAFDALVLKATTAIEVMQERRTALISSAVTGKIDLRNWQNPNNNNEKQGL